MEIDSFHQIASSLTVRSVCSKIRSDISAREPVTSASQDMSIEGSEGGFDPSLYPWRVVEPDDGSTIGMVWLDDVNECLFDEDRQSRETVVKEVMEAISPDRFMSSDTTILEAFEIFCESNRKENHFYILEKNKLIGVLLFSDLYKPLSRLAFLGLALEIEQATLRLCQHREVRQHCWDSLSKKRQSLAYQTYEKRFHRKAEVDLAAEAVRRRRQEVSGVINIEIGRHEPLTELIGCTYLCDKATMIWSCKLISASGRKSVLGFFRKLEKIRNLCAHPNDAGSLIEALPRNYIKKFLLDAKEMLSSLKDAIEEAG